MIMNSKMCKVYQIKSVLNENLTRKGAQILSLRLCF